MTVETVTPSAVDELATFTVTLTQTEAVAITDVSTTETTATQTVVVTTITDTQLPTLLPRLASIAAKSVLGFNVHVVEEFKDREVSGDTGIAARNSLVI